MATIEVSTWAELVSAINSSSSYDGTIKLIADIDCNDEIPEGVTSTIYQDSCDGLTIDGGYVENGVQKRHIIRNLRTSVSSPVTIFRFGKRTDTNVKYTTMQNIDFINLILDKPLIAYKDYYGGVFNAYIRNCRFTGKRTDYLIERKPYNSPSSAQGYVNVYLQNSYFNVPYYGSTESKIALCEYFKQSDAYFYTYADNCRIRTHYTGTYTPAYHDGDVNSEILHMNMSGCRVEGDIVGFAPDEYTYITFNLNSNTASRTPAMQNVYDVDFYIRDVISNKSVNVYACKGLVKKPVKALNSSTTYSDYLEKTDLIFATESQMQDADWLIQQGFDVVPSDT